MAVRTPANRQPLGKRGARTRQRILQAVAEAIEKHGLRGLRLADVATEVGFSAPAFYQYFDDLDDAILALCEEVGQHLPAFWFDDDGWRQESPSGTRPFVARFFQYWDRNRALLAARNIAVSAGDKRFRAIRDETFRPMFQALRARIESGQREGRVDPSVSPVVLSAALTVMLDRIAMLSAELTDYWSAEDTAGITDAIAYIFDRVLGIAPTAAKPAQEPKPVSRRRPRRRRS
jgi:AcrR family transcriptional regulator